MQHLALQKPGRGKYQSGKERHHKRVLSVEQIQHCAGAQVETGDDAKQQCQQKTAVDIAPELQRTPAPASMQDEGIQAFQRVHQLLVDAHHDGDGAAGHTRNRIGNAHGQTLGIQHQPAFQCRLRLVLHIAPECFVSIGFESDAIAGGPAPT